MLQDTKVSTVQTGPTEDPGRDERRTEAHGHSDSHHRKHARTNTPIRDPPRTVSTRVAPNRARRVQHRAPIRRFRVVVRVRIRVGPSIHRFIAVRLFDSSLTRW